MIKPLNKKKLKKQGLIKKLNNQATEIKKLKSHILFLENKCVAGKVYNYLPFRELIAILPGNIFWKDKNGVFLGCNNNHARIYGLKNPNEIIGKTNYDLLDEKLAKKIETIDRRIMNSKTGKLFEEIGIDANGKETIYYSHKIPLFNSAGELLGMLGMSLDISEQKRIEKELIVAIIAKDKAEASDQAKSRFLSVVNHELRTPLASIWNLINFLKNTDHSKEETKIINAIDDSCTHLLRLINDVLDFSKLESGNYKIRNQPVHLSILLNEVHDILISTIKNKKITLSSEIDVRLPAYIITDKNILNQILINLIGNAIKFTEKGNIKTKITCLHKTDTEVELRITVSDTGIGIPIEKINSIFDPFQQVEERYTRQSSRSGTGLGLAIVKDFVNLLGLQINVNSELGKGSTFTLTGTFRIAQENEQIVALKKKKKTKVSKIFPDLLPVAPKIMLIEDDPTIQFVHTKMLKDLGCKVDVFAHGKEAIKALTDHALVFVDISLPDMSGFEVIRAFRKHKNRKKLPLVALTVYTGETEKKNSLEAGASAFANKPISLSELKKILIRYLVRPEIFN